MSPGRRVAMVDPQHAGLTKLSERGQGYPGDQNHSNGWIGTIILDQALPQRSLEPGSEWGEAD